MKRERAGIDGLGADSGGGGGVSPKRGLGAVRIASTALGLLVILVGLGYTVRLLNAAFRVLSAPAGVAPVVSAWADALGGGGGGGDALAFTAGGQTIPGARVAAMLTLAGGALFLAWLATKVMLVGARIVVWTTTDREATRQLLRAALGHDALPREERRDVEANGDRVIEGMSTS